MLSKTALEFKEFYIQVCLQEMANCTSQEDWYDAAMSIRQELEATPFREIVMMAIDDGLIESSDDIYLKEKEQTVKTRTFEFPNGGHSMRKLALELYALGESCVELHIEGNANKQELWFETTDEGNEVTARALADRLLLAGTRFTVEVVDSYRVRELDGSSTTNYIFSMGVHTKVSDIMSYPELYCK
jgi:hypothetical protein